MDNLSELAKFTGGLADDVQGPNGEEQQEQPRQAGIFDDVPPSPDISAMRNPGAYEPEFSEIEQRAVAPRIPMADAIAAQQQMANEEQAARHRPGIVKRMLTNFAQGVYEAQQAQLGHPDLERQRLNLAKQQLDFQQQEALRRQSAKERTMPLPAWMLNELGLDDGFEVPVSAFPQLLVAYNTMKRQAGESPDAIVARRTKYADQFGLKGAERTHYILSGTYAKSDPANTPFELWVAQNPDKPVQQYFQLTHRNAGGSPLTPTPVINGKDVLSALSPQDAALIKKIANYDIDPRTISNRGGNRERVLGLVSMYDPSYDQTQYGSRSKLRQSANSGELATNIRRLNQAVGHLAGFAKAAEGLDNSDFSAWNSVANWTERATGDPRVGRFDTFANAVASEMSAVFKGTGSATDQEIKEWRNTISASASPAQLKSNIEAMLELMGSRLDAIDQQYSKGMGKPRDFAILTPESRSILNTLPGGQRLLQADTVTGSSVESVLPEGGNPFRKKGSK